MMKRDGLNIDVVADTKTLTAKLKAIAKHTQALADELDRIDGVINCPKCGSDQYEESIVYANGRPHMRVSNCFKCGSNKAGE